MNLQAQSRINMFGAWCGLLYIVGIVIGLCLIAGFLPPHRPMANPQAIARIFQTDALRIRIGMIVLMFAAMIVIPFTAAISQRLEAIEGSRGVLSYSALIGGAGTMILTFYPAVWWLVASYRPDRNTDLIYLLNDMAWLQLIGGVSLYFALPASVAVAAFCDSSTSPVFPRWAGFFNIWITLMIIPDQLMFFFHSGPFAWNGLFGFWIPLVAFAAWFYVIFHLLRKAVLRDRYVSGV